MNENKFEVRNPEDVRTLHESITTELKKVIVGQDEIIRFLLVSLFARGHCLLVGVPGLAKTLLVRTLSDVLELNFKRIQFTPDLMPTDILGAELLQEKHQRLEFEFQEGPIFTNLLLADEINRTPPKTQAALLEAMQELSVTTAGHSRKLPEPFLVVATQNPIEQEGTYPLPEAQLDRFMFSLNLDYPDRDEEIEVVKRTTYEELPRANAVVSGEQIVQVNQLLRALPVTDHIVAYAVDLVKSTRPKDPSSAKCAREFLQWGAGPRAAQNLILGAKATALLKGKLTPEADDIREVFLPVLQHRVICNYRASGEGRNAANVLQEIVDSIKEPSY